MQPAVYAELRYRPHPDLLIQPGARVDYYAQLNRFSVDPRLVTRWSMAPDTVLKAGVGLFSQPPVYFESMDVLGNDDLGVTRAIHTGLGVEQRLFERVDLSVEGFYKHLFDRVVATAGGVPPYFVNDGDGRIYGLEASVRAHPIAGMTAYVAYTLSRSERSDRDQPYRLFDEDQTHNLATALGYHFGSGWGLGARFRLISGNPYTPITGASFNANAGLYTPLFGAINSSRSPLFHQLDLNAEKKWSFEAWSLTAYASVLNVYNHQAEEGRNYSYDYRASEPVLGLPILPSLGLRGAF
jgi:outer membrane receptor for ferrienterochelin and colicin